MAENTQQMQQITAYTDGSCMPNPGAGGWAWAITSPEPAAMACHGSSYQAHTTNNRMELTAVMNLLQYLAGFQGEIVVYTDSTYVINGYNKLRKTGKVPAVNGELWEQLLVSTIPMAELRWVKGHSNDPGNELVDSLAKTAAGWER